MSTLCPVCETVNEPGAQRCIVCDESIEPVVQRSAEPPSSVFEFSKNTGNAVDYEPQIRERAAQILVGIKTIATFLRQTLQFLYKFWMWISVLFLILYVIAFFIELLGIVASFLF